MYIEILNNMFNDKDGMNDVNKRLEYIYWYVILSDNGIWFWKLDENCGWI
jgi:hypothetical protein